MSDLARLNVADPAVFEAALSPLFEGVPRFLARVVAARPYESWEALFARSREIAHAMPEAEQLELVDAHPRLGAPPAAVSALSFREQGYDQDHRAEADRAVVAARLEELNDAYEARFGFRYCVFVAGRPRSDLIPGFEAALAGDRESELRRALDAVVDIALDRHRSTTGA